MREFFANFLPKKTQRKPASAGRHLGQGFFIVFLPKKASRRPGIFGKDSRSFLVRLFGRLNAGISTRRALWRSRQIAIDHWNPRPTFQEPQRRGIIPGAPFMDILPMRSWRTSLSRGGDRLRVWAGPSTKHSAEIVNGGTAVGHHT